MLKDGGYGLNKPGYLKHEIGRGKLFVEKIEFNELERIKSSRQIKLTKE